MAALKAGKHVWLEKPMAEPSEQARALVAEAASRGLILHVDHTFLYTGPVQKMRELPLRHSTFPKHNHMNALASVGR